MHVTMKAVHPGNGITLRLTSHTTAVTHTSAGGVHRGVSSPSRPSTLIHPDLELPPGALAYARAVLYDQVSECKCERISLATARRRRLAGSTCGLQVGCLKQALGGHDRNSWTRMHTRMRTLHLPKATNTSAHGTNDPPTECANSVALRCRM